MLFDELLTYGDSFKLALSRAAYLQKQGFKKGDVIGICAETSKEWCITYMAITMGGMIVLPLDTNLDSKEYPQMLKAVNTKAVFASEAQIGKFKKLKKYNTDFTKHVTDGKRFKQIAIKRDFPASYVFTSGTTGNPKIVVLSHLNIFKTSIAASTWLDLNKDDKFLCILPLFHVYAFLANFIGPFSSGSSFIFLQSLKGPDIVRTLSEHQFTVFPAAPQLWELFMDSILNKARAQSVLKYRALLFFLYTTPLFKAIGLGFIPKKVFTPIRKIFGLKIRFFVSGGAPLKKRYFKFYSNMGLPIIEGYGLTETTGPITISHVKRNISGSVGPAMGNNEIRIKNKNSDGIGEIWLRGDSVMKEYYKNPSMTAEVFDKDGFFNSGDLGKVDRKGYLFITGREKNVIVLDSGKNVYPEELEAFYKKSPEISEISVFGHKIDNRETVYAVIVPFQKDKNSYQRIKSEINKLNRGLPSYKTISHFALSFDPLPVNSARKILVGEIITCLKRNAYMTAENDSVLHENEIIPQNDTEKKILAILIKKLGVKELYSSQTLSDFDIDSIGIVDLTVYLEEKISVSINIDTLRSLGTINEVITYIATLPKSDSNNLDDQILRSTISTRHISFFNPINELLGLTVRLTAKFFWNFRINNRENINADNVIYYSNHSSNLDFITTWCYMSYRQRRKIFVIGKKEVSFLKYVFPGINIIFVERGGDIVPAMKASADLLRKGKSLYIFPEGTRSKGEELGEFKTGAAYLAKNLDIKLIPLAIKGAAKILPAGKKWPRFFKSESLTVTAGEKIDPNNYKTVQQLNKAMLKKMADLLKSDN